MLMHTPEKKEENRPKVTADVNSSCYYKILGIYRLKKIFVFFRKIVSLTTIKSENSGIYRLFCGTEGAANFYALKY